MDRMQGDEYGREKRVGNEFGIISWDVAAKGTFVKWLVGYDPRYMSAIDVLTDLWLVLYCKIAHFGGFERMQVAEAFRRSNPEFHLTTS